MIRNVKLCRNCRHYDPDEIKCVHEKAQQINLVTGDVMHISAYGMRNNYDLCSLEGRYYEPWPELIQTLDLSKEPF
jgi:hypothetical protein